MIDHKMNMKSNQIIRQKRQKNNKQIAKNIKIKTNTKH